MSVQQKAIGSAAGITSRGARPRAGPGCGATSTPRTPAAPSAVPAPGRRGSRPAAWRASTWCTVVSWNWRRRQNRAVAWAGSAEKLHDGWSGGSSVRVDTIASTHAAIPVSQRLVPVAPRVGLRTGAPSRALCAAQRCTRPRWSTRSVTTQPGHEGTGADGSAARTVASIADVAAAQGQQGVVVVHGRDTSPGHGPAGAGGHHGPGSAARTVASIAGSRPQGGSAWSSPGARP